MTRGAVFLDRDGTIIRDAHYIGREEQVELLPGAARAIRRLNEAGIPTIVVTNQSGIARGYFTHADYARVHARMVQLLAAEGAGVDAAYMCPHHPDFTGPCECRKPGTLLFRQAVSEHGLDPARSFYVGDKLRDVAPAESLGGVGILLRAPQTPARDIERAEDVHAVAQSLDEAVDRVIESRR